MGQQRHSTDEESDVAAAEAEARDVDADATHPGSWSANLEGPEHAADRERLLREAIEAVEQTRPGVHVNLVTHAEHGHPGDYLFEVLEDRFGDTIEAEYVDQCGCGGYVTRVHVRE